MATESIADLFKAGGPPMFLIVFLTAPTWLAAAVHVLTARKVSLVLSVALVGLVLLVGAGGGLLSWQSSQRSIDMVPEAVREGLLSKGKEEALLPLKLSALMAFIPVLLIFGGEVRRRRRGPGPGTA